MALRKHTLHSVSDRAFGGIRTVGGIWHSDSKECRNRYRVPEFLSLVQLLLNPEKPLGFFPSDRTLVADPETKAFVVK
jgi:hypothetical protein